MPLFSKTSRILKKSEFDSLLRTGLKGGNVYFGLRWKKGDKRRLGIVVSRKTGKAFQRNRIKRVIREFFRLNSEKFPPGDVIVIARRGLENSKKETIWEALRALFSRR